MASRPLGSGAWLLRATNITLPFFGAAREPIKHTDGVVGSGQY